MNYEIERKLSEKADKYELHNIQNENRELKNNIRVLESKIGHLESVNQNRYYALERLCNMLVLNPAFEENINEIYEIRNSL